MTTNNSINRRTDLLNVSPSGTGAGETGEVRFQELAANGTDYVALKAADSTATQTYTLPDAYPASNGQVLSAQTDGTMSWAAAATGGVSGPVSTTQDALVRWDGTDGSTVADSTVTLDGSGNMSGVTSIAGSASVTVEADSLDIVNGNDSTAGAELRLYEASDNGSNYIGVKTPASLASSYTYILPSAYPSSSGQVLSSNTSGTMSWVTSGGGGSSNYTLLDTVSGTDVASIDIVDINDEWSGYSGIVLQMRSGSVINLQVSDDKGVTWFTTGYRFKGLYSTGTSATWTSVGGGANEAAITLTQNTIFDGSSRLFLSGNLGFRDRTFDFRMREMYTPLNITLPTIPDAIRLYNPSSNITATLDIYGYNLY